MISMYSLTPINGFSPIEDAKIASSYKVDGFTLRLLSVPTLHGGVEGFRLYVDWVVDDVTIRRTKVLYYSIDLGSTPLGVFTSEGVIAFGTWLAMATEQFGKGTDTAIDIALIVGKYFSSPMVDNASVAFEESQLDSLAGRETEFNLNVGGLEFTVDEPLQDYEVGIDWAADGEDDVPVTLTQQWIDTLKGLGLDVGDSKDD